MTKAQADQAIKEQVENLYSLQGYFSLHHLMHYTIHPPRYLPLNQWNQTK
jgi:hypothetical protein